MRSWPIKRLFSAARAEFASALALTLISAGEAFQAKDLLRFGRHGLLACSVFDTASL